MIRQAAVIIVSTAVLLATSCGGDEAADTVPPGFPVTVERADGQEITFDRPPQRIVSLSAGHTEILFEIGAGDQVIAVDSQSDFPQETEGRTKFDTTSPDLEAISDLDPDLVVIMSGLEDLIQSLDERGLRVLWLELPDSVGAVLDQIDLLGAVTDQIEQSDELVDSIDAQVLEIFDKVGATAGPRVYHELDNELTTVSPDTFIGELYLILNVENIAGRSEEPYPQLTLDSIVEADPEVIIVAHSDATPEAIRARPGWEEISAVKNDRVYAVDPDLLNRPGPRLVEGLEKLAELIHPEIFPQG